MGILGLSLTASVFAMTGPAGAVDADTSQTLSAAVASPTGGAVTTTFRANTVTAARDGWQGLAATLPRNPEDHTGATSAEDDQDAARSPQRMDGTFTDSPSAHEGEIAFQRFDVDATGAGQRIVFSGRIDSTRTLVMSAWNGTSWETLASGRGTASGDLTLEAGLSDAHDRDGTVHLLLHAVDPFTDDLHNAVRPALENPSDYDFAIAHHSDTQSLARAANSRANALERAEWTRSLTSATQWIADNAASKKIVYSAHTGDLVDQWRTTTEQQKPAVGRSEFATASKAQKILDDAGIITSVLPGNHDNLSGTDNGSGNLYNEYFGPDRFKAQESSAAWRAANATYEPWKPGDNDNSYVTFTAGGLDFVAVSLGFSVNWDEIAWANQVFARFPDRNGILLTHAYGTASVQPNGRGGELLGDGPRLRTSVVAKNPNIALVLYGHKSGVAVDVRTDIGKTGNHVVEMLANYQNHGWQASQVGFDTLSGQSPRSLQKLGASFVRLLQFDVERSEISVDTYSPYRGRFGSTDADTHNRYDGREDDFRVPVQLTSRATSFGTDGLLSLDPTSTPIGTVTTTGSEPAVVRWDGLAPGTTYAWTASSTDDATGDLLLDAASTWFVARRGDDTTPPRLSVPLRSSVGADSTFDPLASVHARSSSGADLTSKIDITGQVNTAFPGASSLFYAVTDEHGNSAVAQRTVVVGKAPAPVNTKAPRITGSAAAGTTLVADRGTWTNLRDADVRIQWLRNGKAISGATGPEYDVRVSDINAVLRVRVEVRATGRYPVEVTSDGVRGAKLTPKRTLTLAKKATTKQKVKLTGRFTNDWKKVTGTVQVKVGSKKVATTKLTSAGKFSVTLPTMKAGTRKVTISYLGTSSFKPLTVTKNVKVTAPKKAKKKAAKKAAAKKAAAKKAAAKKAAAKK
ncbi:immunoglobulin-like domain-containing protein [Nocardioides yefusunii]|uniref:Immunoglobulin-like domain-containing protein n=1 Tax=Nocardioides yefusunii TaxID=2500546 RepID=A0ABW1R074_9ACTN|nr:Ig-like domain repeat protein [Nocardioides yefusunii]